MVTSPFIHTRCKVIRRYIIAYCDEVLLPHFKLDIIVEEKTTLSPPHRIIERLATQKSFIDAIYDTEVIVICISSPLTDRLLL